MSHEIDRQRRSWRGGLTKMATLQCRDVRHINGGESGDATLLQLDVGCADGGEPLPVSPARLYPRPAPARPGFFSYERVRHPVPRAAPDYRSRGATPLTGSGPDRDKEGCTGTAGIPRPVLGTWPSGPTPYTLRPSPSTRP